jgi:NADH:ubiquinone oxidoreductase subunit 6 (subunit J)
LYLLLHAEFIAAVQLVVYVGGTLILIVFGVMLTSKSPNTTYAPKRWEVVWALIVTALVAAPLLALMATAKFPTATPTESSSSASTPPPAGIASGATGAVGELYPMKSLGQALLEPSGYLVPFELVSVLLLAVMIGAAYLAKGRRPKEPAPLHAGGID